MDIGIFDRFKNVSPLLVELHDTHNLYTLAGDKKPAARLHLMRIITDLFQADLSPVEQDIVCDILCTLLKNATKELRVGLAHALADRDDVPLPLVLRLANDEIDVATHILERSAVLDMLDLVYIIKSKPAPYWRAVAKRKDLNEHLSTMLVRTRDMPTAINLAHNHDIILGYDAMEILAEMARASDELAEPLLARKELDRDLALELYRFVGARLKIYIAKHYDVSGDMLMEYLDQVVEHCVNLKYKSFKPNPIMMNIAEKAAQKGVLNQNLLMKALQKGRIKTFVALYARFTGLSCNRIIRYLSDREPRDLAELCKLHEIKKPSFLSMYILTNPMRSHNRIVDTAEIERISRIYDEAKNEES